jgi:outer membrane lipoprotein-sorting protein
MNNMRAVRCATVATAMTLIAPHAIAAPTAQEIMAKSVAAVKGLKSYQAVMQMNMSMGTMGSVAMQMDLKSMGDKKTAVSTRPAGQATGQMAMLAQLLTMQIVDDGTNMWMYRPAAKAYSKGPSAGGSSNPFNVQQMMKNSGGTTFKLVGTENVAGHPAYVIQIIPKSQTAGPKNSKVLMYIDSGTYRFRQMKMTGSVPAGPNQPPQPMNVSVVVKSEKVNQPIPASVFKFTPPPGATQMQGGMGMGNPFGGMLGGGGGRR